MTTINFTKQAPAISDFNAQNVVEGILLSIEKDVKEVKLCNVLLWNMLRAELIDSPLKSKVRWEFEGRSIDMDEDMKTGQFWQHPVTKLEDKALMRLISPSVLNEG